MGNTQASTQCITWQNANERQKLKIQLAVWLCVRVCSEMTVNWELIRNTELSEDEGEKAYQTEQRRNAIEE